MVTHNLESTESTQRGLSLAEWEQRTSWETVLAGTDLPEGAAFYRCDDPDAKFDGTERWTDAPYEDDDEAVVLIAHETHLELADADSEPPLWWPRESTKPVDKLTAYAGMREISRAEAARAIGLDETSVIESMGWIFSYPGLDKVAKAAKARGVNPWGVLGAVMAWVAVDIPPEVTTLGEQQGKGTFNLFVALCGEPGAGKGRTMQLASDMVRREIRGNFVTAEFNKPMRAPVGSPEGMISARRVAQAPDMPSRAEVADVLKSLKPGRSYGGLTKRYIDNLSGHPGHFFARHDRDFDRFISQRKAYRAEIARRALALNIHAGEERERKYS